MAEPAPAAAAFADDDALVRGVLAGERDALEALMRQHNQRLYRIARAVLRDAAEAEDALQEVYVTALKSLHQFRGEASLSSWLARAVLNHCLGRLRRNARRQKVVPLLRAAPGADVETPDRLVARAQLRALLERKLDELPEIFRVVFVLRGVEDMSVAEASECLGLPEATVRTRFFRARRLLRESLAEELDLAEGDAFDFGRERCDRMVAAVCARVLSDR